MLKEDISVSSENRKLIRQRVCRAGDPTRRIQCPGSVPGLQKFSLQGEVPAV